VRILGKGQISELGDQGLIDRGCREVKARQYPDARGIVPTSFGARWTASTGWCLSGRHGAKLITNSPDYLYAQYTTPRMKYVDDVEVWFDPKNNAIQVRSSSRLGEGDLGVNRKRFEVVCAALAVVP